VGTYTDGQSEGIYRFELLSDGKLRDKGLVAKTENPSFLALSAKGDYLLAVNEVSNKENMGYVTSYKIKNDSLFQIDQKPSGGAHPCHLTVRSDDYVVVANYTGGNMGLLKLDKNGALSGLLDVQQHQGKGSHERQEAPHAHSGWITPDGKLISVDLGTNQLWFSEINPVSNRFVASTPATYTMGEGAGPRHLAIHPTQDWIYVVNELTSSISLIKKDSTTNNYLSLQTIATLPEGFTEPNTCADIHISSDGKFVYASNRGHNSIAIFTVEPDTGILNLSGHESTMGDTPRNFTLSPDTNFLLVANQNSDNIVSFQRNIDTGLLTFVDKIEVPNPVCLLF
jgi:6-phosphogluconolactonase